MTIASGARVAVGYVTESTRGTTPGSPTLKTFRATSRNVNPQKNVLSSAELRPDRQLKDERHGFRSVQGSLGFELSVDSYNDQLEYLMAAAWVAGSTITTGTTTIDGVATGNKFTRASGSFLTNGFRPGQHVTTTGFTGGNNGTFRIKTVTALELAVDGTIANDTGSGNESISVTGKILSVGTTLTAFTLERQFPDITRYQAFRGCVINGMSLSVQPEAVIGGSFDLIGMSGGSFSGTSVSGSALSVAPTYSPFDSFNGVIAIGGTSVAVVTGINFNMTNGRTTQAVVGSRTSPDVFEGQSRLQGDISVFLEDATYLDAFDNETELKLVLRLNDIDGVEWMSFNMDRVKINGANIDPPQEGPITLQMPWRALINDETGGLNTTLQIQRSTTT